MRSVINLSTENVKIKAIINAARTLFQEHKIQLFLLTERIWNNVFEGEHQKVLSIFSFSFIFFEWLYGISMQIGWDLVENGSTN